MKKNLRMAAMTALVAVSESVFASGGYVAGDFHQHTTYTDGSYSFGVMMDKSNAFGLDWWANSEHGGAFDRWGLVSGNDLPSGATVKWGATNIPLLGKDNSGKMWRWQSLRDWNFRDVRLYRRIYPQKQILQGYEMNVPGHEHASVMILGEQFDAENPNVNALAEFEYRFDNNDKDDSAPEGWVKSNLSGHAKAIEAVRWLQDHYPTQSWVIPAHPERYQYNGNTGWNIEHFRDLNEAAPDVFFGFESIPGHQMSSRRGEYGAGRPSYGLCTYGGAGWMSARVGGLWDALLSEGRRFWLFANSDCHNNADGAGDFFPGEYQKTYSYALDKNDPQTIVDGLRSGNSYAVMGDLIDSLDFRAGDAVMGSTQYTSDGNVVLSIRVRDPQGSNHNRYSDYTMPALHHIDVIAGVVGSKIEASDPLYVVDEVATTRVIARFAQEAGAVDAAGIVTQSWKDLGDGWKEMSMTYAVPDGQTCYFRLRGTNQEVNVTGETDAYGNPLIDPETNNASKAFADLWFYSNPVYATSTAVVDTKTFVIQSASDDVEEWLAPGLGQTQSNPVGDLDYNSSDLELGCEGGSHTDPQMVGLRFSNIDLPQGKYILSAQIDLEVDAVSKQADPCTLVIRVEDADDAATFTTQNQPFLLTSRLKLSDSIVWELKPTELNAVDARGLSVDVAPLVQRILQRSGWKSGNALAFYITGTGTREVESYEGEPTAAAKLHIRYAMNAQEIEAKRLTDSIKTVVDQTYAGLNQAEYTIPSWTEMLRSYVQADGNPTPGSLEEFKQDLVAMKPATLPYNVCIAMNGDPKAQFGLTWYTNQGVNPGVVALVEGVHTDASAFVAPVAFAADTLHLWNVNYSVSRNELQVKAGLENYSKRNYTVHKALVTGLKANTTYSYRVGYEGNWSEIGTFTTAPESADDYSFLYIADTQAHNDDYFSVSERTVKTAAANMPDMKFCMMTGDMVETSGSNNSEWEWEQWFERMQPVWKHTPIAPICGNHDKSSNKNLTHHFNTEKVGFDQELSTTPGSVYSFVYGDALFIAASTEDYSKAGYLDSLKNFIRAEVAAHPEVKWKIAFYHKAIYTGSRSHQSDRDARTVREALVPVFDEVGIDMCFQGHDHIYEVMGATKEFKLVENSSWGIEDAALRGVRENMTGKQGGVYDVSNGTLFFLNNSAGKKKYEPRNEAEMEAAYSAHGITNYWGLFTGKFGQTGEPTYSDVRVTRDTLFVQTYTVDDAGTATLFDAFKVVKSEKVEDLPTQSLAATRASIALIPNPTSSSVEVQGLESVDAMELYTLAGMRLQQSTASTRLSVEGCTPGTYVVKVYSGNDVFVEKLLVQ